MRRFLFCILFLFTISITIGQISSTVAYSFRVDDFSKDYYGIVKVSDTTTVFTSGTITIYDKKTNKPIIKIESGELALDLKNGEIKSNIHDLPYGEQSIIMYDDFNFDGIKDFAIENGQNSCYHLPSYEIYIAGKNGFYKDDDFTKLAQENCGMFDIDSKEKEIHTMTKSGCCWHQFSDYIIENNKPKAIRILEDDEQHEPYSIINVQTWNGREMIKTYRKTISFGQNEGIKPVFSFWLEGKDKEVILFNINDRTLNYALIRKDSTVEFSYPEDTPYKNPDFTFRTLANQMNILFQNGTTQYKIYEITNSEGNETVGIEVTVDGKTTNLKGVPATKKGSLMDIPGIKLDNVY
jgi:hypothetical protein